MKMWNISAIKVVFSIFSDDISLVNLALALKSISIQNVSTLDSLDKGFNLCNIFTIFCVSAEVFSTLFLLL